ETDQNRWVMILEDFGGTSLTELALARSLTTFDFLQLALQITQAVRALHHQQIIHLHLTPDNIIINRQTNQLKLIDFGLASKLIPDQAPTPAPMSGTLAYLAPEQTGRIAQPIDTRTDLYALGVIFYELLVGQVPFMAEDTLALFHSHLAQRPKPPTELNSTIPLALSEVILKLLAKDTINRYQSIDGLEADLKNCLSQWTTTQKIDQFPLGQRDPHTRLHIPDKLYGRTAESQHLLAAFDRSCQGEQTLLFLTGAAGVGKSVLIKSLQPSVIKADGLFIMGKFDQLQRNVPYSAIGQALRQLSQQLLISTQQEISQWQQKLQESVTPNGQLLVELAPELAQIIGPQPALPVLNPVEAQNRFQLVFQKFISLFAQKEHPLVICLDDLQWADEASLHLWTQLAVDPHLEHLLLIGAYRDQEIDEAHPLTTTLTTLEAHNLSIEQISLGPLSETQLHGLVEETLICPTQQTQPLTRIILDQTEGNPFFVHQFLHWLAEQSLLHFDPAQECWAWNLGEIQAIQLNDNIIELLSEKLTILPDETARQIKLAACLGNTFDPETITLVEGISLDQLEETLQPALDELLILKESVVTTAEQQTGEPTTYRFLHDRIQQAAYESIPDNQKPQHHLKIGRQLLASLSEEGVGERLFEIVDHLNLGATVITEQSEQDKLARLNLRAGKKAKQATAYQAALNYLTMGWILLGEANWQRRYELTFALHLEAVESHYLIGNPEAAEQFFELALSHAKTRLDKAELYNKKVVALSQNQPSKAVTVAREALKLFGIHLSSKPNQVSILLEILKVRWYTGRKRINELIHEAEVTNLEIKAAKELLMNIVTSAYFNSELEVMTWAALKLAILSLRYGNSNISAYAYAIYGIILISGFNRFDSGYDFGKLAVQLNNKYDNNQLKSKLAVMFGHSIYPFKNRLGPDRKILKDGYYSGTIYGDFPYAAYAGRAYAISFFIKGDSLDDCREAIELYIDLAQQINQVDTIYEYIALRQTIFNLKGLTEHNLSWNDIDFNENEHVTSIKNAPPLTIHRYYICRVQTLYIFEGYSEAFNMITKATKLVASAAPTLYAPEHYFYYSLILTAIYSTVPRVEQWRYWRTLKKNQRKMKRWATHCPENFEHKYLLVAAEMARLSNQPLAAMSLYDQAIQSAQDNEFTQNEAIANE
ncbi:MAG: serine/threonine-protein kinase PknK, partial [Chloroflexota bacterium]